MDPIDEQCLAFVVFILCYMVIRRLGQDKSVFGQATGCATGHKVVHMLIYYKNLIKMNQVAYETELSGTPTAVFTEIQLIGQFLVLGIIILI